MKRKLCTIVIPAYNEGKYVVKCVKSFLNQTYKNLEIMVINDCSTDNTLSLVKKEFSKNKKVRICTNDQNMGMSYSRNRGITEGNGEFILQADGDAYYPEDYVEKMIAPLRDKSVGGTVPEIYYVWCENKNFLYHFWTIRRLVTRKLKKKGKRKVMGAWCFRRKIFDEIGLYDRKLKSGNDVDVAFRVEEKGYKIAMVDTYFTHKEQTDFTNFVKRMWRVFNLFEFHKKWDQWPKGFDYLLLWIRNLISLLILPLIIMGFFNPVYWMGALAIILAEAFGPIVVDQLWRGIFLFGVKKKKYFWSFVQYPFIIWVLARVTGYARMSREILYFLRGK